MNENQTTTPFLSKKSYDFLKWVAQILLPALGALYFTLSGIWDLPNGEQVVGTITAVDLFLGLLLQVSTTQYNKSDAKFDGAIDIVETDNAKRFSLNLKGDPNELDQKNQVVFKVNPPL